MQVLRGRSASFSKIPHGAWNGCQPPLARPSEICWSRGSCETGGHGYCFDQWPSVGSSPCSPCT